MTAPQFKPIVEKREVWRLSDRRLSLDRPLIMGIVNVTPDSFSDGGAYLDPDKAVARALQLVAEGADLIDLGAESTRPGAAPVPAEVQIERLVPVLRRLRDQTDVPISIDTTSAAVAERTLDVGAQAINDVSALRFDPRLAGVVARSGAGLVLMHMRGTPRTMQDDPRYDDVVSEVAAFLADRLDWACQAGIDPEAIVLDPGIGFGKRLIDNLTILRRCSAFAIRGRPVLIGPSRKSFIGALLDAPVEDRLEGTLAAAVAGVLSGAGIVRVHDVAPALKALRVAAALAHVPPTRGR